MGKVEYFNFGEFDISKLRGFTFYLNCEDEITKQELFHQYAMGLNAPGKYFGLNWDAFNDCLMDLNWLDERQINIVHTCLPRLPERDLGIYLDNLSTASSEWKSIKTADLENKYPEFKPHRLEIYFPKSSKKQINNILNPK